MLSYEDSKRLRELGYSQELEEGDWVYYHDFAANGPQLMTSQNQKEGFPHPRAYVKVPTTDGMVEGLGGEFVALHQHPDGGFWAEGSDAVVAMFARTKETTDQALCELWKKVKSVPTSQ